MAAEQRQSVAQQYRELDVQHARRLEADGAVLVDVREDHEWAAGSAPGARHIPLSRLAERLHEIPPDRTVLLICRSGRRSAHGSTCSPRRAPPGANSRARAARASKTTWLARYPRRPKSGIATRSNTAWIPDAGPQTRVTSSHQRMKRGCSDATPAALLRAPAARRSAR